MDQAQQLRNVIKRQNLASSDKKEQKDEKPKASKARVVTVTSGKGGVGKSNLSVNLAIQLRKLGKRVIIFDADIGLANVEVMFGAIPKYNLSDLIYKDKNLRDIVSEGPMGIGFISGGSGIMGLNNLDEGQLNRLVDGLKELEDMADVIIIDTGAGISDYVLKFLLISPEILLVTTPEPSSITDSYSLLKILYRHPEFDRSSSKINLVANKVLSVEEGTILYEKLNTVFFKFLGGELNYLGMVPLDMALERAVRQQKIVSIQNPSANASRAFEVLAQNFLNDTHEMVSMKKSISQLFSKLVKKGE